MDFIDESACKAGHVCFYEQQQIEACRKSIGMGPNECYNPDTYKGQCHKEERDLKRCVAFSCCKKTYAETFYDKTAPRRERWKANLKLHKCLNELDIFFRCMDTVKDEPR